MVGFISSKKQANAYDSVDWNWILYGCSTGEPGRKGLCLSVMVFSRGSGGKKKQTNLKEGGF